MYDLTKRGYARPGQDADDLLEGFSIDILLNFVWGWLRENVETKKWKELEGHLKRADEAYMTRRQRWQKMKNRKARAVANGLVPEGLPENINPADLDAVEDWIAEQNERTKKELEEVTTNA